MGCPHLFLWIQFSHVYPQTGLHAYVPCNSIKTCQDCLVSLALLNAIYHTQDQQKGTGNEWGLIISAGFVVKSFEASIFHLSASLERGASIPRQILHVISSVSTPRNAAH